MNIGSQILIFDAVEFFAALNNTCISDRTIALLLPCLWICSSKTIVPADFFVRHHDANKARPTYTRPALPFAARHIHGHAAVCPLYTA